MLNFDLGAATNPAISGLQQALLALARASGDARLNPGLISGELNDATMIALSVGLDLAIRKTGDMSVPASIALLIQVSALTDEAKQRATAYAPTLTRVLQAAVVAYTTGTLDPNRPPTNTTPSNLPQVDLSQLVPVRAQALRAEAPARPGASAPKWYATWWGIGGLIVLGGLAYKVLNDSAKA
jgi:hypothetical protein